jgi:hypothetical protein
MCGHAGARCGNPAFASSIEDALRVVVLANAPFITMETETFWAFRGPVTASGPIVRAVTNLQIKGKTVAAAGTALINTVGGEWMAESTA